MVRHQPAERGTDDRAVLARRLRAKARVDPRLHDARDEVDVGVALGHP
jgi:hypothetical protein